MKTPFDPNTRDSNEMDRPKEDQSPQSSINDSPQDDALTFLRSQSKQTTPSTSTTPDANETPARQFSLSTKVMLNAIAIASLPIVVLGITASVWVNSRIQPLKSSDQSAAVAQLKPLESQLPILFGIGAICSGAIAAVVAKRSVRPVIKAAERSNTVLNRLERHTQAVRDRVNGRHELVGLNHNLIALENQIPRLLSQTESATERFQQLMGITDKVRSALTQEEVFRTAVDEIRSAFRADRVAIYRLDSEIDGTIIEESVAPGFPKMLWSVLEDPCLENYITQYQQGRVRAINDIHNSNLDDCHIGLLDRFAIKANLIAPLLKDQQLFGMIIVNQCDKPRVWLSHEIELLSQLTGQISFAVDFVKLLEAKTQQVDQNQLFINIVRKVRGTLNEDQILQTMVTEWRKTLRAERVMIYGFDAKWYGTVLAEDVVPGIPKALNAEIYDPCFAEGYVEKYREGRVQAVDDIMQAGLTDCHLQQLEPFHVKANLVAPILKDDQLFGLLIAHACKAPRHWQSWEVDLHQQLAMQVGYALDHARLLQRLDTDMNQMQQLINLSKKILRSLDEAEILKLTVEQVRKVLQSDRVMVYRFDPNWYGTVVAESVVPGYPKALWAEIHDPCFAQGFVTQYQEGRVQAVNNIYEAGLTKCHLQQLEPFAVKANLVAPILKDDKLFGLLIAHECEKPREWQPQEISLMRQISLQVGVALDHAQMLAQVDASYQASEQASQSQQARNQSLQQAVSQWVKEGKESASLLEASAVKQLDAVTQVYQDLKVNLQTAESAQSFIDPLVTTQAQLVGMLQEMTLQTQDLSSLLEAVYHTQHTLAESTRTNDQLKHQSTEQLDTVKDITSQLKLQAMNTALEAARMGDPGKEFAKIGEQVLNLTRKLDAALTTVQPLLQQWKSQEQTLWSEVADSSQHLEQSVQQMHQLQEHCDRLLETHQPLKANLDSLSTAMTEQTATIDTISNDFLEMASHVRQTSEQSVILSQMIARWNQSQKEG